MSPRSKPPHKTSSAPRSYTLLWFKNETAAPVRLSLSKKLLMTLGLLAFAFAGVIAAIGLEYTELKATALEYEKLRVENRSIRSEAKALSARLQSIQSTLTQVDEFSDQVRAVVQMDPDAKKKSLGETAPDTDLKVDSFSQGIGPLTKDEYELYEHSKNGEMGSDKIATAVNPDSLEFKNLFVTLDAIREKGGSQAKHLEVLVGDLQAYRKQVDATPTISPVKGAVTSMYGVRVSPFFQGNRKMHWGLDIAAPMGSPIRSAAHGTVVKVGHVDDYGIFVEVSHGYGVVTRYAHASAIHVKVGDKVEKGTQLGAVGTTGRTTGPHLHYEIEVNGRKVDPASYIRNW